MINAVESIWAICEPAVTDMGLELVDVEQARAPGGAVIRLYVDKDGGVAVGDCARVSREVGYLLDAEDLIEGRYFLEVSSPGINRALRKREHFEKFRGQAARVLLKEPVGGRRKLVGQIDSIGEDNLRLRTDNQEVVEVPLSMIEKANLQGEVSFGKRSNTGRETGKRGKRR
ncbi:MAG: ribosome maturation factor RimP [Candidatus Eisenbacteria bacterium]